MPNSGWHHNTLTLTKFIIPACMDTVVELGLVESPEGQIWVGLGRLVLCFLRRNNCLLLLKWLGLGFWSFAGGCSMCILGGGVWASRTLYFISNIRFRLVSVSFVSSHLLAHGCLALSTKMGNFFYCIFARIIKNRNFEKNLHFAFFFDDVITPSASTPSTKRPLVYLWSLLPYIRSIVVR